MTEHEKLKAICDVIGYDMQDNIKKTKWDTMIYWLWILSPRDIIFTTEFMEKLRERNRNLLDATNTDMILYNLDDPVSYLYNLLELWHK